MDIFSHPLFLLLVGALVSGLLIPWFTSRWQNHQKELELKTQLATDITETVTAFVLAIQFAELGAVGQSQEDFDAGYRDWEIRNAVISSKLRVYFPDPELRDEWSRFARFATDFYALSGSGLEKPAQTKRLLELVGASRTLPASDQDDLSRLVSLGVPEAQVDWATLKAHVLSWKDAIVKDLLAAQSILTRRSR